MKYKGTCLFFIPSRTPLFLEQSKHVPQKNGVGRVGKGTRGGNPRPDRGPNREVGFITD